MGTNKYYLFVLLTFNIFLSFSFTIAQDSDNIKIEMIKLTDKFFVLPGMGNIGVYVGDDGVLLIDDQFPELTEKIKTAISSISTKSVKFIINTHFHADHVGGNEQLSKSGVLIISHDNTRKRLTEEQYIEFFESKYPSLSENALPKLTFSNSLTLNLNEDEIYAFHPPFAHTDGDAIIYFRKQNILHMGDIYQTGGFPFIDVPNGGTINGMIDAVEQALKIINAETKVIPGHGPLSNQGELAAFKEMLITVRDKVQEQLKQNKSIDEIISSKPARGYFEELEHPISADDFVKFIYDSLIN